MPTTLTGSIDYIIGGGTTGAISMLSGNTGQFVMFVFAFGVLALIITVGLWFIGVAKSHANP